MLAIAMYHGVTPTPLPVFNWCQLELSKFEEQVRFLSENYRIMRLREVVETISRGQALPGRAAVITFDDGLQSVYRHAFPVLARYQAPFTVFLVTSLVGTGQMIWTDRLFSALLHTQMPKLEYAGRKLPLNDADQRSAAYRDISAQLKRFDDSERVSTLEFLLSRLGETQEENSAFRLMNWEEISTLERSGLADFGSHTHTHPILSRCNYERRDQELKQSRAVLLERFGVADLFAYPNGTREDFEEVTKKLVVESGYRGAVSTIPGLNSRDSDVYEFRRINIGANTSFPAFERMLLGD
jgi:peptidoglycan/xylan/chitin deacetylase (PgdA/CDA1 family)